jgi:predicted CoA-binding protein
MARMNGSNNEEQILKEYRTIAMVGASDKPGKASHRVFNYLIGEGYHVIPVNPEIENVSDHKSYPNLADVSEKIEVVDIFRKSEHVPAIIDKTIEAGAKAVWMQEGVINEEAAKKAMDAGLLVVMDRCMRKEHIRLAGEGKL